jgi:hypothetical protein
MDDGADVDALAIDVDVHRQLGRGSTARACLTVTRVDDDEIGRPHVAFGDATGGNEDPPSAQSGRDVAFGASNQTAIVESPADIDDRSSRRRLTAARGGHDRYRAAR